MSRLSVNSFAGIWRKLACDNEGKVVVFQLPNPPLIGWLTCTSLRILVPLGDQTDLVSFLGEAFLFTWAYLELAQGTTYLRRLLGFVVLLGLIYSRLSN